MNDDCYIISNKNIWSKLGIYNIKNIFRNFFDEEKYSLKDMYTDKEKSYIPYLQEHLEYLEYKALKKIIENINGVSLEELLKLYEKINSIYLEERSIREEIASASLSYSLQREYSERKDIIDLLLEGIQLCIDNYVLYNIKKDNKSYENIIPYIYLYMLGKHIGIQLHIEFEYKNTIFGITDICINTDVDVPIKVIGKEVKTLDNFVYDVNSFNEEEKWLDNLQLNNSFEQSYNFTPDVFFNIGIHFLREMDKVKREILVISKRCFLDFIDIEFSIDIKYIDNFILNSEKLDRYVNKKSENYEKKFITRLGTNKNRCTLNPYIEYEGYIYIAKSMLDKSLLNYQNAFQYGVALYTGKDTDDFIKEVNEKANSLGKIFEIKVKEKFESVKKYNMFQGVNYSEIVVSEKNIGNYDVIGIDTNNKNIFIIECKYKALSNNILKSKDDINSLILSDGELDRFKKRVDAIKSSGKEELKKFFERETGQKISGNYKIYFFFVVSKTLYISSDYFEGCEIFSYSSIDKIVNLIETSDELCCIECSI